MPGLDGFQTKRALDEGGIAAPVVFLSMVDDDDHVGVDHLSSTYTYLLASHSGGEALLIDPVLENLEQYLQLIRELELKLVLALDTHIHADHITALGRLRDRVAADHDGTVFQGRMRFDQAR